MKKVTAVLGVIIVLLLFFVLVDHFYKFSKTKVVAIEVAKKVTSTLKPVDNLRSVVEIQCREDNDNTLISQGSGTILRTDGQLVLTNNHVVIGTSSCLVIIPSPIGGIEPTAYTAIPEVIPGLSNLYDIALLKITGSYVDQNRKIWGVYPTTFVSFTTPSTCKNELPQLGDPLRIYGYPVTNADFVNGIPVKENLTVTDGVVSSFKDNGDILTTAQANHGSSGGLAVNQQTGCMIGIPYQVQLVDSQSLTEIIPRNVIIDFFEKIKTQDLSFHLPDSTPVPAQGEQSSSNQSVILPTSSSITIDCTGPDGKHFQATQQECDAFNQAWANTPTTTPSNSGLSNDTSSPTDTPIPTATTAPDYTPAPTDTPLPIDTSVPTIAPTSVPPTSVPTNISPTPIPTGVLPTIVPTIGLPTTTPTSNPTKGLSLPTITLPVLTP